MTESPTTENGLFHTEEANLDDRLIRATYATAPQAQAMRDRLIQSGMAAERITVIDNAARDDQVKADLQPRDKSVIGRIREAILPEDSNTSTIDAARHHEAILELRPEKEEVESAVKLIEDSKPAHFDAGLERWRNAG